MEPRAARPGAAVKDHRGFSQAQAFPVGIMVAPMIPGLTDHEAPAILAAARQAGAQWAGKVIVRLPWAVAPLFEKVAPEVHRPDSKEKYIAPHPGSSRGKLYDSRWGVRARGEGRGMPNMWRLFQMWR